jgi:hypothetical protein
MQALDWCFIYDALIEAGLVTESRHGTTFLAALESAELKVPSPFIVPDRSDLPEADLVANIAIGRSASGLLVISSKSCKWQANPD